MQVNCLVTVGVFVIWLKQQTISELPFRFFNVQIMITKIYFSNTSVFQFSMRFTFLEMLFLGTSYTNRDWIEQTFILH